jgi:hypothetical protein
VRVDHASGSLKRGDPEPVKTTTVVCRTRRKRFQHTFHTDRLSDADAIRMAKQLFENQLMIRDC